MEEKGLRVYNYFKTKGIKGIPKEIANSIQNIQNKVVRKKKFDFNEKSIIKSLGELGFITRDKGSNLNLIRSWFEFLSVLQDIRILELSH